MPELYPYQVEGVEQAVRFYANGNHGVLLADDMGLGKTAQALALVDTQPTEHVLVVSPSSVKLNWLKECDLWLTDGDYVRHLMQGRGLRVMTPGFNMITVVNYDILAHTDFSNAEYDLAIFDEAHYLKNPKAKRTKAAMKIRAKRKLLLTGTPIVNRPMELFSLLMLCGVVEKADMHAFGLKYCGAYQEWIFIPGGNGRKKRVWNYDGASNLEELNAWLRRLCMIRRMKADVLTDLPPKTRQIIELDSGSYREPDYMAAVKKLNDDVQLAFEEISLIRHETALAKVGQCVEFIENALLSSKKVVVFCHHRDVIDELVSALDNPVDRTVILVGGMGDERKQWAVDQFRTNPDKKVFIGQMQAAGTGVDGLQDVCDHAIFVELPWSPSELNQCEDRLHRIGQNGNVLVQHLVLDNSIDARIAKTLVRKQNLIEKAVDGSAADINWLEELA